MVGRRINRVDVQVCIIVAVVVAFSFLSVYLFSYAVTYDEMITSLKERSDSIHAALEDEIDRDTFRSIEDADDMNKPSYRSVKLTLDSVKEGTGVRYLYTAKKTDDGSFIYVVDGLPEDSEDFRAPGDAIEPEIVPEMERALAGETVYPADIKDTGWGYVFVAYYPVHDGGEILGVMGMEFDAQRQYEVFRIVRIGTLLIAIGFCLIAIVVSYLVFRRVSNPWYRDLANTDYLTDLKNRNAFETDVVNWERGNRSCEGIVCADVDGLKHMNDTRGHAAGDELIKAAAEALAQVCGHEAAVYRLGGDEFAACLFACDEARAAALAEQVHAVCAQREVEGSPVSLSVGWAVRQPGEDIEAMLSRADARMYKQKRRAHEARR